MVPFLVSVPGVGYEQSAHVWSGYGDLPAVFFTALTVALHSETGCLAPGVIVTGRVLGTLAANRADVGTQSIPLLNSDLTAQHAYLRVAWGSDGLLIVGFVAKAAATTSDRGQVRDQPPR